MGLKTLIKQLLLQQCRRPSGWLGEYVTRKMNVRHGQLTTWGLEHISVGRDFTILDIGCGGGKTIQRLARMADSGKVFGIDAAAKSVAVSQRTNRQAIRNRQVAISQASVSKLPFPDGMFDCVTAVETHYFWPDFASDLREVLRVLKPNGTLLLLAEVYRCEKFDARNRQWLDLLHMGYYSADEFRHFFSAAGYADVTLDEQTDDGWLCCLGHKPAAGASVSLSTIAPA